MHGKLRMKRPYYRWLFLIPIFLLFLSQVSAQSWTQLSSLPSSAKVRNHPVTFSINGYGYLLTGHDGIDAFKDFYRYDPNNDTWTQMTDFPGASRGFAYGVTHNGKAYVGFGLDPNYQYLKDWWVYDPGTNQWTQLADCQCSGRRHPAMVSLNGKIYVGLGDDNSFDDLQDWWAYDIATNSWSKKKDFPATKRHHPFYFGIGNDIFVGLGHHGSSIFKDFYKYTPATDQWAAVQPLPAQGRVAGTQFTYNGKGYVLSGQGENHFNLPTGEFWEYDPVNDQWASLTAHPGTGRWAPGSFLIGNKAYLTCGEEGHSSLTTNKSDLWVYDFPVVASTKDVVDELGIKIFPVPAKDYIQIQANKALKDLSITVKTIDGRNIKSVSTSSDIQERLLLKTAELPPGNYVLHFKHPRFNTTSRLISIK